MTMNLKKYEQVAQRVEKLIADGVIKSGTKVPSIRQMSKQMNFSIMTILEGYQLLETKGIIESKPQSGYFVKSDFLRSSDSWLRLPEARAENITIYTDYVDLSESVENLFNEAMDNTVVPLGAGLPDAEFLPLEEINKRMARIVRSIDVNRYSIGSGTKELRDSLSRHMIGCGCTVSADEISVTGGAIQALMLALRAVAQPGDAVAVESPGYYGFYSMLKFLNLRAIEIPSHPQNGISVEALEKILKKKEAVSSVLLSPCFSNPTGSSMPLSEKKKLIKLAEQYDLPLIEDDIYGEISYGDERPCALKSINNDQVIYLSSMSKTIAPGYRVGWISGGKYHKDIERCHALSVLAVATPNQLLISSLLDDNIFKRHLKKLRKSYYENMVLFQNKIAHCFPDGTRTSNPQGGYFLWIELPCGCDSKSLAQKARKENISIAPGMIFSSRDSYKNYIRLNCAVPWSQEIEDALEKLGELIRDR